MQRPDNDDAAPLSEFRARLLGRSERARKAAEQAAEAQLSSSLAAARKLAAQRDAYAKAVHTAQAQRDNARTSLDRFTPYLVVTLRDYIQHDAVDDLRSAHAQQIFDGSSAQVFENPEVVFQLMHHAILVGAKGCATFLLSEAAELNYNSTFPLLEQLEIALFYGQLDIASIILKNLRSQQSTPSEQACLDRLLPILEDPCYVNKRDALSDWFNEHFRGGDTIMANLRASHKPLVQPPIERFLKRALDATPLTDRQQLHHLLSNHPAVQQDIGLSKTAAENLNVWITDHWAILQTDSRLNRDKLTIAFNSALVLAAEKASTRAALHPELLGFYHQLILQVKQLANSSQDTYEFWVALTERLNSGNHLLIDIDFDRRPQDKVQLVLEKLLQRLAMLDSNYPALPELMELLPDDLKFIPPGIAATDSAASDSAVANLSASADDGLDTGTGGAGDDEEAAPSLTMSPYGRGSG